MGELFEMVLLLGWGCILNHLTIVYLDYSMTDYQST